MASPEPEVPELQYFLTALEQLQIGSRPKSSVSSNWPPDVELLEAIFAGSTDAIFLKERSGKYLAINGAGARMLGKTVAEVVGQDDRALFSHDVAEQLFATDLAIMEEGCVRTVEEFASMRGEIRHFAASKGPMRSRDGKVVGLWGVARDITDQLSLEKERAQLTRELQQRVDELEEARARLLHHEKLAALGELAAVVAHEVRNPLCAIVNAVAAMRKAPELSDRAAVLLDIVGEEAESIEHMVSDLLDFARPAPPMLVLQPLMPVLDEAIAAACAAPAPRIRLEKVFPSEGISIPLDPRLMRQALLNLFNNATQAMPAGGTLKVSAVLDSGKLHLEISDTGEGIPQEKLDQVFQPFFTTRAKGNGLGLYLVKRIVEDHRGTISISSRPGHGTCVSIHLPAADSFPVESARDQTLLHFAAGSRR